MQVLCAWCKVEIRETPDDVELISHGICRECMVAFFEGNPSRVQIFINGFNFPIAIVDFQGVVQMANKVIGLFTNKSHLEMSNILGGDLFECKYAKLPEGCGKTEHCSGCTIRNAVMETFLLGTNKIKVPARLYQNKKTYELTITTQKIGEAVVLKIDDMK